MSPLITGKPITPSSISNNQPLNARKCYTLPSIANGQPLNARKPIHPLPIMMSSVYVLGKNLTWLLLYKMAVKKNTFAFTFSENSLHKSNTNTRFYDLAKCYDIRNKA